MKSITPTLLLFLSFSLSVMAQRPLRDSLPQRVDAVKVGYLTNYMQLSPEEAQAFWPIYNAFVRERRAIVESLGVEGPIGRLSDEEVKDALDKMLEREARVAELHRAYVERFLEVLSPRQVLLLHQGERRFNRELLDRLRERRGRQRYREERNGLRERPRGNRN